MNFKNVFLPGISIFIIAFVFSLGFFVHPTFAAREVVSISTCEELQNMSNGDSDAQIFQLTGNIDCSMTNPDDESFDNEGPWLNGIGFEPLSMDRIELDGQGHTISGIFINRPAYSQVGLFSTLYNSNIHDLFLTDVNIRGYSTVGAVVGQLDADSLLWGVHVTGEVMADNENGAGGLVGFMSGRSVIEQSSFEGNVTHGNANEIGSQRYLGGLVGAMFDSSTINNSYANAELEGFHEVGGLVGEMYSNSSIINSYAIGTATGTDSTGGLVGYVYDNVMTGIIQNSFAAVSVNVDDPEEVGGLIGFSAEGMVTMQNSYFDQTIAGVTNCVGSGDDTGCAEVLNSAYFTDPANPPMLSWDFDDIWADGGASYPILTNELSPIGPDAPVINTPSVNGNVITLSWNNPEDSGTFDLAAPSSRYELQMKLHSDEWDDAIFDDFINDNDYDADAPSHTFGLLQVGTEYDMRVRVWSMHGFVSEWNEVSATTEVGTNKTISSCEELQRIGNDDAYSLIDNYVLTQNIDCAATAEWNGGDGFMPIGAEETRFWGSFDGQNHTISNLHIHRPDQDYVGLFGVIEEGGSVSHLGLLNASITGDDIVGAFAGALSGTLTDVYSTGEVIGDDSVGGLVGDHIEPLGDGSSSPLLYTWNGNSYDFVADVGRGLPRNLTGIDYAQVDSESLAPLDNKYSVKLSQEYNEIVYFDEFSLMTFDHAPGYRVLTSMARNSEGQFFTIADEPSNPLLSCIDQYGNNCVSELGTSDNTWSHKDESNVNSWVMDFGDLSNAERIQLVFQGARDYALPGVNTRRVEVKNAEGNWVEVYGNNDISAGGTPRTYVLDMTHKFLTDDYEVRVTLDRTRMNYFAIDTSAPVEYTATTYHPETVNLGFRGFTAIDKTYFWDHKYDQVSSTPEQLFATQSGHFTKYGDVTPLLENTDNQFVIMHYGDHMDIEFPYVPPADGLERSFVFYNYANFKHANLGDDGRTTDPLPYEGMTSYPTNGYPMTPENEAYLQEWNTRVINGPLSHGSTIIDSYSNATVTGIESVGGLVGYNEKLITGSYATGNVSGTDYYIGGLVGEDGGGTIERSYATGNVSGQQYIGGFAGITEGRTEESYATGNVNGQYYVGGFAGYINSSAVIFNTYARGAVEGSEGGESIGGFAGITAGTLENSYATGLVTGVTSVGGLIGTTYNEAVHSFWDSQTSEQIESDGGNAKTTSEMKAIATFTTDLEENTWDFDDIWNIDGTTNDGYPFLRMVASENNEEPEEEPQEEPVVETSSRSGGRSGGRQGATLAVASTGTTFPITSLPPSNITNLPVGRDLTLNSTGNDVRLLQQFLNTHGFPVSLVGPGSLNSETDLFGSLTRQALSKFQAANNISPALGYYGPVTRAFILAIGATIPTTLPTTLPITPLAPETLRDLTTGMSGTDVKWLQEFLITENTGPAALELKSVTATGFFSTYTFNALIEYQKAVGINPASGMFGSISRAYLKTLGFEQPAQ